jgi:hypothetical protein
MTPLNELIQNVEKPFQSHRDARDGGTGRSTLRKVAGRSTAMDRRMHVTFAADGARSNEGWVEATSPVERLNAPRPLSVEVAEAPQPAGLSRPIKGIAIQVSDHRWQRGWTASHYGKSNDSINMRDDGDRNHQGALCGGQMPDECRTMAAVASATLYSGLPCFHARVEVQCRSVCCTSGNFDHKGSHRAATRMKPMCSEGSALESPTNAEAVADKRARTGLEIRYEAEHALGRHWPSEGKASTKGTAMRYDRRLSRASLQGIRRVCRHDSGSTKAGGRCVHRRSESIHGGGEAVGVVISRFAHGRSGGSVPTPGVAGEQGDAGAEGSSTRLGAPVR